MLYSRTFLIGLLLMVFTGTSYSQNTVFDEKTVTEEILLREKNLSAPDLKTYIKYRKDKHYAAKNAPVVNNSRSVSFSPVSCTNAGFEDGSFTGWDGTTGCNPNQLAPCPFTPGIFTGRHSITTGSGFDPIVGSPLTEVATGGIYSVRLGNGSPGAEAEQLLQTFTVTQASANFAYKYAVVLEDPGHAPEEQPFFKIEVFIRDSITNDTTHLPCAQYFVAAGAGVPGFQTTNYMGKTIRWKDWTTVSVNLQQYIGQTVTIRFTTADCSLGAHFGYAYVDCSCNFGAIAQSDSLCAGGSVAITAPEGYTNYLWSQGGSTTRTITVSNPGTYVVTVTTVQGCTFPLTHNIIQHAVIPIQVVSPPVACKGDSITISTLGRRKYQWSWINNPSVIIKTDTFLTITPTANTSYLIYGYCPNETVTVPVLTKEGPPVNIVASSDTICYGNGTVLSGAGAQTYTWTNPAGAVLSTGKNLFIQPYVNTTYILTGRDEFNCKNNDTIRITVRGLPTISSSSSPDSICPGATATLTGSGAAQYFWSVITAPNVYIGSDNTLQVTPFASTTYLVAGVDAYGCRNSDTVSVFVKNKPPERHIQGSTYVCPGLKGVKYRISDNFPGFPVSTGTYKWSVSNAVIPAGQVLNSDSLTVDFGAIPGTAYIYAVETNREGCTGDTMKLAVSIKKIFNPPAPQGPKALCSRDRFNIAYNTPFNTTGSVYVWHILNGTVKSGNNTPNVVVDWTTSNGTGKLWFQEFSTTATDSCYGTSDTLEVTIFPSPSGDTLIGERKSCENDTKVYFIGGPASSVYQWTVNGGTIESQNGSTIMVKWIKPGTGTVKVIETTNKGCKGDTLYAYVTVHPLPVVTGITGPSPVCLSESSYTYIAQGNFSSSTFSWVAENGTLLGGAGNDTVDIRWTIDNSAHKLFVTEISEHGCVGKTISISVSTIRSTAAIEYVSCVPGWKNVLDIRWTPGAGVASAYTLFKRPNAPASSSDTLWSILKKDFYALDYRDLQVLTRKASYQYKYSSVNACMDTVHSLPHNSILLGAKEIKGENTIELKWNSYRNWPGGVSHYEIWRKMDNESDFSLYSDAGTDTTARINALDGFIQCFSVKAVQNGKAIHSWSNDTCVEIDHRINVPTAFSPNGDGTNDTWVIRNIEVYKDATVEVFNRWGEQVLNVKEYKNDWKGNFNGKSLPDGTYYYIIHLKRNIADQPETFTGPVTIVR
jgi:gliding motility-associated-like protein